MNTYRSFTLKTIAGEAIGTIELKHWPVADQAPTRIDEDGNAYESLAARARRGVDRLWGVFIDGEQVSGVHNDVEGIYMVGTKDFNLASEALHEYGRLIDEQMVGDYIAKTTGMSDDDPRWTDADADSMFDSMVDPGWRMELGVVANEERLALAAEGWAKRVAAGREGRA